MPIFRFSPSFIVKSGQKCCKFALSLFGPGQSKSPNLGLKLQSQTLFPKEVIGTAVSGLFVKIVGLFGPKPLLNCRNVKHVKLYLSKKKAKNCGGEWPHRHACMYIHIYIYTLTLRQIYIYTYTYRETE